MKKGHTAAVWQSQDPDIELLSAVDSFSDISWAPVHGPGSILSSLLVP